MSGGRVVVTGISAAAGACFAAIAGLSINEMAHPVRRFHVYSIPISAVAIILALLAFRSAVFGNADEDAVSAAFHRAILGAFLGFVVIGAFLVMFGPDTRMLLAHSLGKPTSTFTTARLLIACAVLGFGIGFTVKKP